MIVMWWLSLALAAVVVGVVAALLGQVIAAAKSVDHHAAAIWTVGKQIAGNTVSIWMLEKTNQELESIRETGRSLERAVATIDERLRALAGSDGRKG